ncbi:MAG: hypothetical protein JNK53_00570, partial [Phycisphaerae bacterium]|nr:hypothetical protein [Phycisphaerae bacterium]
MKQYTLTATALACAFATAASAEFFPGQPVAIIGTATDSPNPGIVDTTWGTNQTPDQGFHHLGGQSEYYDSVYGPTLPVFVSSTVINPWSVVFSINFAAFVASDYSHYTIDIFGLKSDGSILGASGNFGMFSTDGNSIHWE